MILRELYAHWWLFLALWLTLASELPCGAACRWVQDPQTGQWVRVCDQQQQPQPDAGGWYLFQERGWKFTSLVHLTDGGSGVVISIEGRPMILSCAHKDHRGAPFAEGDRCGFTLNTGQRFNTTVVEVMPIPADVCIMRIDEPMGQVQYCTIATEPAKAGDKVTLFGFPNGSFKARNAIVRGYADDGALEITGAGTGGESGGPVFNTRGEIVGILSRTDQSVSWCCPVPVMQQACHRVRLRLDQLFPNRSGAIIARANPPTQQPDGCGIPSGSVQPPTSPPNFDDPQWAAWRVEIESRIALINQCECGENDYATKAELNLFVDELTELVKLCRDHNKVTQNNTIVMEAMVDRIIALESRPVPPTADQTTAAVLARLQPIHIRVQDARGADYSTEYQEIRLGTQKQYVTLPFGPRN